jgi:prefoldin subunit 5
MDVSVTPDVNAFAEEANVTPVVNSGTDAPTVDTSKFYTEEDLAKVRGQEKDKLYPQIEKLKEELDALKRDKDEQELARKAIEEAKALEERERAEDEMGVRDLLKAKEQEWAEQLERERGERERAFALLDREKTFAEIQNYRTSRLEDERDSIIPELVDLINGNSIEEIEQSIQGLKERSSRILDSAQQAMQSARREMTGTRVTTPPNAGPMDIETGTRQFTAEDIAAMPLNEYAKYRSQLLSPNAQGRSQGLFG